MLQLSAGWHQTAGKRDYQEDGVSRMAWSNGFSLALLSDGMGGVAHGDVASREILRAFSETFCEEESESIVSRFQNSLIATNNHLSDYVRLNPDCDGMGGTLIAVAFSGESVDWLSVGDSPLWLVRENEILRLNEDHSRKAELMQLVEAGQMTAEEVAVHPQRNQLTSAVMGYSIDHVDISSTPVQNGDVLLLASDGVESIPEQELASMCDRFSDEGPQALAEHIVSPVESLDRPHQDNATVIVLKISGEQE